MEYYVIFVAEKIVTALANEAVKLSTSNLEEICKSAAALQANMEHIELELKCIHGYLIGIDKDSVETDPFMKSWIRGVRTETYAMEDIVVEYIYVSKYNIKKILSFLKHDAEIKRIRASLGHLSDIYNKWHKPDNRPAVCEIEQEQCFHDNLFSTNNEIPIGIHRNRERIHRNREKLIESLRSNNPSLHIIAVWGMAGVGKSTLVHTVYSSEVPDFDCHAWISIPTSYKEDDILKNMLHILGQDRKELDRKAMISKLINILKDKRYLIVLDGIWSENAYSTVAPVLFENQHRSRVVITTRTEKVALNANEGCKINVEPLNHEDAWDLFCRKAFPKIPNHTCPLELKDWVRKIVDKCDGLPLALVEIGNYLSTNKQWCQFYEQLSWELHNTKGISRVKNILNLSYKYLPDYLKNCFLYCAMFPEGYLIPRKRLIKLWIAEGFIEKKGERNLEDIAHDYLTELTQRSMLQVAVRNSFGRIKSLRMHNLVRELAIYQSEIEGFYRICGEEVNEEQVKSDLRRVSVLHCNNGIQFCKLSRLRTFITFDNNMPADPSWCHSILQKVKYLAVLDLSGLPIYTIPDSIGDLFNLRLLSLNDTKVSELPKSVRKLCNLQTLSLVRTPALNFPQEVSKMESLRHFSACRFNSGVVEGMHPFKDLSKLHGLQTLGIVKSSKSFVEKLGNLSNLRSLGISDVLTSHCTELCNSLSNMHHISSLQILAYKEDEVLQLDNLNFRNPLLKLALYGRLSEATLASPFFKVHGNQLLQIHLWFCQLTENQFSQLCEFSNLTELFLVLDAYSGENLKFHKGQLRNLKKLGLKGLQHVNQIYIYDEALLSLEYLLVINLQNLSDVPVGISFLKSLKEARFIDMHNNFASSFEKAKRDHPDVPMSNTRSTAESPCPGCGRCNHH